MLSKMLACFTRVKLLNNSIFLVTAVWAATAVELEIVLVSRPLGHGNVVLATRAHVQRVEAAAMPGWYGIAASYDDVQFDRDDSVPSRFLK